MEVSEKVSAFRKMLMGVEMEKKGFADVDDFGRPVTKDSHQELAALKEKNTRLRSAFGLDDDFVDGSSFSRNRAEIEKATKEAKKNYKMVSSDEDESEDDKKKKKRKKSSKDKKKKGKGKQNLAAMSMCNRPIESY